MLPVHRIHLDLWHSERDHELASHTRFLRDGDALAHEVVRPAARRVIDQPTRMRDAVVPRRRPLAGGREVRQA
jgi:hypothetical protein